MGIFNIFKRKINKSAVAQPKFVKDYVPLFSSYVGTDSTAFSCIDRIASEFAGLNYAIYNVNDRQKTKRHPLYKVLKEPNLDDRHFNFFYQSAIDYFDGGCFWYPVKIDGETVSIFRLNEKQVKITRDAKTNRRLYQYNGRTFIDDELIYIPSRFDYSASKGGRSIFASVSSVFETASKLEKYTQNSFENGAVGKRVMIDVTQAYPDLTAEQAADIKNTFQAEYAGVENAGRPLLQKKGIVYSEFGSNNTADNRSAELAANRELQEKEIAKVFGVPVQLLNGMKDKDQLENIFVLFNEFALRPMATQFQEAINSLLDEDKYYFEFDYNGVMKVSLQQRIEAYTKQINNGLLSPNEARAKENLPPVEAGENHFMPVNLMPLNNETINAYMAKQKNEIANGSGADNSTGEGSQHFGGGDDKQ